MERGLPQRMFRFAAGVALATLALDRAGAESAGDIARGEAAFVRQCALCHTVHRGDANAYGPNLFGIVNKRAGAVPGYKYSGAFKAAASWDWSPDALGAWISAPEQMVPGTTMGAFQGVADRDKDDIVAYLSAQK